MLSMTRLLSRRWKKRARHNGERRQQARGDHRAVADARVERRGRPRASRACTAEAGSPAASSAIDPAAASIQSVGPAVRHADHGHAVLDRAQPRHARVSAAAQAPRARFVGDHDEQPRARRDAKRAPPRDGSRRCRRSRRSARARAPARGSKQRLARAAASEAAGPEPRAREQAREPARRARARRTAPGGPSPRRPCVRPSPVARTAVFRQLVCPGVGTCHAPGHQRRLEVVGDRGQERVARRTERSLPGRLRPHDQVGAFRDDGLRQVEKPAQVALEPLRDVALALGDRGLHGRDPQPLAARLEAVAPRAAAARAASGAASTSASPSRAAAGMRGHPDEARVDADTIQAERP